jgi:signal transduction histidine kinase/ligand-binding sensor domain-containing protein
MRALMPTSHFNCFCFPLLKLILLAALLCSGQALAIDPTEMLSELHHTRWTMRDGVPAGIYALAQSSDGYLWIGSDVGLFKFDGVSFEPLELPNGERPIVDPVMTLLALPSNGLLIGMRFGGAYLLRDGHLTQYGDREGLPKHSVMAFAVRDDGSWWAQTPVGLYRLDGAVWKRVGEDWQYPATHGDSLIVGLDGTLWSRSLDGTFFLPRGESAFRKSPLPGATGNFAICGDGRTWLSEDLVGIGALPDPATRIYSTTLGGEKAKASYPGYVFCDREGGLWSTLFIEDQIHVFRVADLVGFVKRGYKFASKQAQAFPTTEAVPTNGSSFSMLEDREGTMWVATADALERFRSNKLHSALEGIPSFHPILAVTPRGDVWLATRHRLWRFPPPQERPQAKTDFIDHQGGGDPIDNLLIDRDGSAWVTQGYNHLSVYSNNKWRPIQTPRGYISAMAQDYAGDVWIALPHSGLYRRTMSDWVLNGGISGLPDEVPLTLTTDAQGRLWAGYDDGQVAVIDGDSVRMMGNLGVTVLGRVTAIAVRKQIWLADPKSVGLYLDERFWPLASDDKMPGGVSGIVQTDAGDLWIQGSEGVGHVSGNDIAAFVADHRYRVHAEIFNFEDGMKGSPQQLADLPSAHLGGDGKVWFVTSDGAYWINPSDVHRNSTKPPVLVTSVFAKGKNYLRETGVTIPAGIPNFEVNYTALSLSMPSRVRFKYQLEGVDAGWQEVGTRRQAFYTNVPPGQHKFRVIAANEDGVWNDIGASIDVISLPTFYQTRWFYTVCAMIICLMLWQMYRLRVRQLAKQLQERMGARLEERERIARELHDTLLQSTQGLILLFQGFAGRVRDPQPMRKEMELALDQADSLLNEARDRVSDLRTTGLEINVEQAITRASEELFPDSSTKVAVVTTGTPRPLVLAVADDSYRIAREALTNACAHAKAKMIEIEIAYETEQFRLNIRDDGRGLGAEVLQNGSKPKHFGLQGMRERAQRSGGTLNLWSRDGAGTEIALKIPARKAYAEFQKRTRWIPTDFFRRQR